MKRKTSFVCRRQQCLFCRTEKPLIKVKYCGICGSDIHVLRGEHPTARFPVIPGHEFVGELVDIKGSGSQRYEIGDYVVAQPFFSCGNCEPCAKGEDNVCADLQFMALTPTADSPSTSKYRPGRCTGFRRTWICSWQR